MKGALARLACWLILAAACGPLNDPLSPTDEDSALVWRELAVGLEWAQADGPGAFSGRLTLLRIDAGRHEFRLHYRPGAPLSGDEWRAELPDAVAFMNANFYDEQQRALGWLLADGRQYSAPRARYGGAFIVRDGEARVLPRLPADLNVEQATQGLPTLVRDGQAATNLDGLQLARRAAIAEDEKGRILLVVAGGLGTTMAALGQWLAEAPPGIVHAVNLDGGGSAMLVVAAAEDIGLAARDPVPAVLAIYPRAP